MKASNRKNDFPVGLELPALEYCSLERAARLIGSGCEVGDILHWAEIGAIKLSKEFTGNEEYSSSVFFDGDLNFISKLLFETGQITNFYINLSKFSIFSTSDLVSCETVDDIISVGTKYSDEIKLNGYLRGIWDVRKFSIDHTRKEQFRNVSFSILGDSEFNVVAVVPEEIGFSENGLLISRKNIEIILGRELRRLPIEDNNSTEIFVGEEESRTIAYNRAAFIKALLAVHYGADVAEKPRSFIDDPESQIRIDFDMKEIKIPSGRSVSDWLKGVDIKL